MQVPLIIIRELLKGKHIDVKERVQRGAPVTTTLAYKDVLMILVNMLDEFDSFPYSFDDLEFNNYEGISIEKRDGKFICHAQRALPTEPDVIAEKNSKEFNSAEEAAKYYLKWALNLPGDLDGYSVVDNP